MENTNQSEQQSAYRNYEESIREPLSVGQWVLTILIAGIPIVGLVMIFVWAFSGNTNINKANWAKATLIWIVVSIFVAIIILSITGVAFLANTYDF